MLRPFLDGNNMIAQQKKPINNYRSKENSDSPQKNNFLNMMLYTSNRTIY